MKHLTYTTWHRDRGGKLILRQKRYRVIGRSHVLERGLALRDYAMTMLVSAAWFGAVLLLALSLGCGSAEGSPATQEGPNSAEAGLILNQPEVVQESEKSQARNWCCAGERFGTPVLACGYSIRPSYAQLCYCAGSVLSDGTCRDTEEYVPGTVCTSAALVCW